MSTGSATAAGLRLPTLGSALPRLLSWAAVFVVAGYVGRATIIDLGSLSLVWPAAGISALWLSSAEGSRQRLVDAVVFMACTFVVNASTGAPAEFALLFVATNLLQVALFRLLVRRQCPHLWGFGGREPLRRLRDLGTLVLAATTACLGGAALGALGLGLLTGSASFDTLLVWWGRNATGLLVVGTLGLLVLGPVALRPRPRSVRSAWSTLVEELTPGSTRGAREAVAISVLTTALLYVVFVSDSAEPLAFLLLFTTVMAGVRFRPLGAAVHGLLTGSVAIALTIAGHGPFAAVHDLDDRALLVQVFIAMTVVTGLVLAFSRAERDGAITELNAAMDRLVVSEREAEDRATLFAAVLDHMREGIVVLQSDGQVVVRNQAGRQILGLQGPGYETVQPAEHYGLHHSDGRRVTDAEMPFAPAFAGIEVEPEDFHVHRPDAADGRVVEIGASPMAGPTPEAPTRAVVHFRDVTAARQERDSLASFAGVVAHDLSNPLTALRGWAQVLGDMYEDGSFDLGSGYDMVQRIQTSAELMSQFIDDLLSYTLSRDTHLTPRDVDLSAVAHEVAEMRSQGAVRPYVEVQDGLLVHADPLLTRQLLDNLIGNAVKYVAPGVVPHVEIAGRERDGWLEVSVSDNGIGVPEEMRQRIFENFQRVHQEGYRGTGIGLAICRRVVHRHGGTIGVTPAAEGSGSRFVFTLPRVSAAPGQSSLESVHSTV